MNYKIFLICVILFLVGLEWIGENVTRGYVVWISAVVLIGGYILYLTAVRMKYKERQTPYVPTYKPFVSIIIPAKDEGNVIQQTIKDMVKIVYHKSDGKPNYELFIVDDGSTDKTLILAQELLEEYPQLRVHHRASRPRSSKAAVLNEILPLSKGEIFCVFDADAKIAPNFLERIIPYLADPKVGAVQAQKRISNPNVNFLTSAQDDELIMLRSLEEGKDLAESAAELKGNGMLVKKVALEDVGGWNENALTEDLDMSTRLHLHNWSIRYCPEIEVLEEGITTFKAFFRQRRRWMEGGIKRYLDYFIPLMALNLPITKKVDVLVFFLTIIIPIWFAIDIGFIVKNFIISGIFKPSLFIIILIVIIGVTVLNVSIGLYKAGVTKTGHLIIRTLRNTIYILHWIPVGIYTALIILVSFKPPDWRKTEHYGED